MTVRVSFRAALTKLRFPTAADIAVLSALGLAPATAQAETDSRCYDTANAQTVGQAGWTGCEGMYIVKDRAELAAVVGAGSPFKITYSGTAYGLSDNSFYRTFTGQVTDMSSLFEGNSTFTLPINSWDTSNVTNMSRMFYNADEFNADIGDWDTSSVTDMDWMFTSAIAFNQDLSDWNVRLIPSKPPLFDLDSTSWTNDPGWRPQWGTSGMPRVVAVTSPDADGTYGAGEVISVDVRFSQPVTITDPGGAGPLELTLETGASDAVATYASGDGTNTLRFTYTVDAGHYSPDLDVTSASALVLNGLELGNGTTPANTTLPAPGATRSLGANKALVIDTRNPDCDDPDNAQTVGGPGWTGNCEGMYIVKDRAELQIGVGNGLRFTVASSDYTFADGPNRIFTGQVTNMSYLFANPSTFNGDIGYWDTSNVTNM